MTYFAIQLYLVTSMKNKVFNMLNYRELHSLLEPQIKRQEFTILVIC